MSMFRQLDSALIHTIRRVTIPFARAGFFVSFVWFGALKVFGLSPVDGLVENLFNHTITFMDFHTFMVGFGLFECLIGVLFVIKGAERVVIPLLFAHMITTFLPLWLLPSVTWSAPWVPTLEGQYILKNLFIIGAGLGIAAHLHPLPRRV